MSGGGSPPDTRRLEGFRRPSPLSGSHSSGSRGCVSCSSQGAEGRAQRWVAARCGWLPPPTCATDEGRTAPLSFGVMSLLAYSRRGPEPYVQVCMAGQAPLVARLGPAGRLHAGDHQRQCLVNGRSEPPYLQGQLGLKPLLFPTFHLDAGQRSQRRPSLLTPLEASVVPSQLATKLVELHLWNCNSAC